MGLVPLFNKEARTRMEQLLLDLLLRLESIGDIDKSLYDTVVREKMGKAVFFGFIKPQAGFVLPGDYGMPKESNEAIRAAITVYIEGTDAIASATLIDTFHKRLAAFQNSEVRTTNQKNSFDDFFGWSNPELFDEVGNVIRLH